MENAHYRLRDFLHALPNGYPSTDSGIEIRILEKIFSKEEASLLPNLRMKFETAESISQRTGIDAGYLKIMLPIMSDKGQLFGVSFGDVSLYKALPFVFGIYEFQVRRIDSELAGLCDEYFKEAFGKEFFGRSPALMKVIPIGIDMKENTSIEPYESVASLIEGAKAWAVNDCICKKEKMLNGKQCEKPMEVCLAFAPVEHIFDDGKSGRPITKEDAYRILKISEEAGLVHMTSNVRSGHFYICNCCKCCCGPLSNYIATSKNAAAKSSFTAAVDAGLCTSCGTCAERCQADAVEIADHAVIEDCIGCGLCVSTCPSGAISMVRREKEDTLPVPENEKEWMEMRARDRGIGDGYKKLL